MEWRSSAALRAVMAIRLAFLAAVCYVLIWFFFPRVFLLPVVTLVAATAVAALLVPCSVVLDQAVGTVTIRCAWVVFRRVPLTHIEDVQSEGRLGFDFRFSNGEGFGISPFRKRRWLERWLRIRTGFEGMEPAIAAAVAEANAACPPDPAKRAAPGIFWAGVVFGAGLLSLTAAFLVRPQVSGRLVGVTQRRRPSGQTRHTFPFIIDLDVECDREGVHGARGQQRFGHAHAGQRRRRHHRHRSELSNVSTVPVPRLSGTET